MQAAQRFEIKVGGKYRHYQIESLIGRGGMGAVYRGRHEITGRVAAIKVQKLRLGAGRNDAVQLERFKREAALLTTFEHPCLPRIYEMDLVDGTPILVMEYLEGQDLAHVLHERGALTVQEALWIALEVAKPLVPLHAQGVVHRDLKPANIFICNEGKHRVRVLDFGISLQKNQKGLTSRELLVGTICYIAPEYLGGKPLDGRADQYSLGCILFELLDGQPLFLAGLSEKPPAIVLSHWHCTKEIPDLRKKRPDLPEHVWAIVKRLLAKTPEERFPSTEELCEALREAQQRELAERRAVVSSGTAPAPTSEPDTEVGEPPARSSERLLRPPGAAPVVPPAFAPEPQIRSLPDVAVRPTGAISTTLESPRLASAARSGYPTRHVAVEVETAVTAATLLSELFVTTPMRRDEIGASLPDEVAPPVAPAPAPRFGTVPIATVGEIRRETPTAPPAAAPTASSTHDGASRVVDAKSLTRWLSQHANAYLRSCGALHIEAARGALEEALGATEPRLRTAAASELSIIGDARSIPALRAAQEREDAPMVLFMLEHTLELLARVPARDDADTSPLPRGSVTPPASAPFGPDTQAQRASTPSPESPARLAVMSSVDRVSQDAVTAAEAHFALLIEGVEIPIAEGQAVSLGLRKGDTVAGLVRLEVGPEVVRVMDIYDRASRASRTFRTTKRSDEPLGLLFPGGVLEVVSPAGPKYRLRLCARKRVPAEVPRYVWLNDLRAKRPRGVRASLHGVAAALRLRHPDRTFVVFAWLVLLAAVLLLAALLRFAIVAEAGSPTGSHVARLEARCAGTFFF